MMDWYKLHTGKAATAIPPSAIWRNEKENGQPSEKRRLVGLETIFEGPTLQRGCAHHAPRLVRPQFDSNMASSCRVAVRERRTKIAHSVRARCKPGNVKHARPGQVVSPRQVRGAIAPFGILA